MVSPEGTGNVGGEFPLTEWSRLGLLYDLAGHVAQAEAHNAASQRVRRPELAAIMAAVGEADAGERPEVTSHLRRIAAVTYFLYAADDRERPELDHEFYNTVEQELGGEMEELHLLAQTWHVTKLPYPWDVAYEDLLSLEDSGGVP